MWRRCSPGFRLLHRFYRTRERRREQYPCADSGPAFERRCDNSEAVTDSDYARSPAWSPDGKKIAFVRTNGDEDKTRST